MYHKFKPGTKFKMHGGNYVIVDIYFMKPGSFNAKRIKYSVVIDLDSTHLPKTLWTLEMQYKTLRKRYQDGYFKIN